MCRSVTSHAHPPPAAPHGPLTGSPRPPRTRLALTGRRHRPYALPPAAPSSPQRQRRAAPGGRAGNPRSLPSPLPPLRSQRGCATTLVAAGGWRPAGSQWARGSSEQGVQLRADGPARSSPRRSGAGPGGSSSRSSSRTGSSSGGMRRRGVRALLLLLGVALALAVLARGAAAEEDEGERGMGGMGGVWGGGRLPQRVIKAGSTQRIRCGKGGGKQLS